MRVAYPRITMRTSSQPQTIDLILSDSHHHQSLPCCGGVYETLLGMRDCSRGLGRREQLPRHILYGFRDLRLVLSEELWESGAIRLHSVRP
jgi:hypothetical protein